MTELQSETRHVQNTEYIQKKGTNGHQPDAPDWRSMPWRCPGDDAQRRNAVEAVVASCPCCTCRRLRPADPDLRFSKRYIAIPEAESIGNQQRFQALLTKTSNFGPCKQLGREQPVTIQRDLAVWTQGIAQRPTRPVPPPCARSRPIAL